MSLLSRKKMLFAIDHLADDHIPAVQRGLGMPDRFVDKAFQHTNENGGLLYFQVDRLFLKIGTRSISDAVHVTPGALFR